MKLGVEKKNVKRKVNMSDEKQILKETFDLLYEAFGKLTDEGVKTDRHISIVKTKLEEAMMWLNKNRASKKYFEKKLDTHVE